MKLFKLLFLLPLLYFGAGGALSAQPSREDDVAEKADAIEISIAHWGIANSFPENCEDDPARRYIEDRFGITIRPAGVTWGDAHEKLNIWAASGQLPDVIGGIAMVGSRRYHQWIEDGLVRPLPSDLSSFPHIQTYVTSPQVKTYDVAGKTYILPRITYRNSSWWAMDRGLLVRKDWRQKLAIPIPSNEDDFIRMCVRLSREQSESRDADPVVGLAVTVNEFLWSQGFPNYGYTDHLWIQDTDGKYRLGHTTENAFRLFRFLRKLYHQGGLDPDFAISNRNMVVEKFASGGAGVLLTQVTPKHLMKVQRAWSRLQPDKKFEECLEILPLWEAPGCSTSMFVEKFYWSESYLEASVTGGKLERILALFDFLYSDAGIAFCAYGFENEDFVRTENAVKLLKQDAEGGFLSVEDQYPLMRGGFASLATWNDIIQYENPSYSPFVRSMAQTERDLRLAQWKIPEIDWAIQALNIPEKNDLAIEFGVEWIRFILNDTDKTDMELYAEMQERWCANGYDAAIEAVSAEAAGLHNKQP